MAKTKYRFDFHSLSYQKVESKWVLKALSYLATGIVFVAITLVVAYNTIDSPKEKKLKREIEELTLQYDLLNQRMSQVDQVLADVQQRDNNIYRTIFEAEPISENVRKAGYGGSERYKELQNYDNSELLIETTKKLDRLSKQLYIQSKSFDEVIALAKTKEQLLSAIPAIQPISNKDLKHAPCGYGWRTHPIYKNNEFHPGMDFTANTGTEIYATGDGIIESADNLANGYGNHVVINHGYGYKTLYGHMSKIKARAGQKVKRGEVIGYVGNTGLSTGPHVHYEVIKSGEKVNPINFYYNDLSPAQYELLVKQASQNAQSFD